MTPGSIGEHFDALKALIVIILLEFIIHGKLSFNRAAEDSSGEDAVECVTS
jgi:hypothetical protein